MVELGFLVGLIAALLGLDRVLAHVERVRASRAAGTADRIEPLPAPRSGSRRSLDRSGLPALEIPPRQIASRQPTVRQVTARQPATRQASRTATRAGCETGDCTA